MNKAKEKIYILINNIKFYNKFDIFFKEFINNL